MSGVYSLSKHNMAKKLEWETVRRRVDDLLPFPGNPRKLDDQQQAALTKSLKRFSLVEIPVADLDNTILAGHARLWTLQMLKRGSEMVDVRIPSRKLSDNERKSYLLTSNAVKGSWDYDILRTFDTELILDIGFNADELQNLWDDLQTDNDQFNEEAELAKIKVPTVKPGDLIQLGVHKLLCADATDEKMVRKLVGNELIDFVDVDGPFNIKYSYQGKNNKYGGSEKDDKTPDEYSAFMKALIKNSLAVSKKDAHFVYWCDERWVFLIQQLYRELGIDSKRLCIWVKNNSMPTVKVAFNKATEFACYGTRGTPFLNDKLKNLNTILNKEVEGGSRAISDIIDLFSIWLEKRLPTDQYEHPTQKPPTLHEKALRRCTRVGDNVLDLCAGSGSLMVACEQMKRRSFLCEVDPIFATLITKRYELLTKNKARKLN